MNQCARNCILLCLVGMATSMQAQFNETIRTDRPGQAIGPFAVGKSVFQIQAGIDYHSNVERIFPQQKSWLAPNTVLRYGISRTIDVNMIWEYQSGVSHFLNSIQDYNGISVGGIGARIHIFGLKPKQVKVGIQFTALLPKLSDYFKQDKIHPSAKVIIAQNFGSKFSGLINIGSVFNADINKYNHNYVLNLGYTINDRYSVFIENYGGYSNARFINKWDTGIAYMYNHNLQFDLYGGYSKNYNSIQKFISIGVSWRVICANNKQSTVKEN